VTFSVLLVCICVINNCHRVATQLQLNISYIKTPKTNVYLMYTRKFSFSLPRRQLFSITMTTRLILLKEVTGIYCDKYIKHKRILYDKYSTCLMLQMVEYTVTIGPSTAISIYRSLTKDVVTLNIVTDGINPKTTSVST
jgi:hypothetical protein